MKKELISIVDFVKFINSLTTTELIKEFPNHFTEYRPSLHKDMVRYLLSIDAIKWKITKEFMQFLNTPLNLSMFVPCVKVGDKWEVLEDKGECSCAGNTDYCHGCNSLHYHCDAFKESEQYQKAKENVIFEGFEVYTPKNNSHGLSLINDGGIIINFSLNFTPKHPTRTIQDLIKYKPTLTEQGMIKSGLK